MVSFSCEACGDILTKKKLDPHRNQCRGATFTCIDCMVHFYGTDYRSHTSCMTEAQKYQGALYREKPTKNQRKAQQNNGKQNQKQNNAHGHRAPYVEDANDTDNPPAAPTPPVTGNDKSQEASTQNGDKQVNVFDYLVAEKTPNASKVSLGGSKEQMKMVANAPSVFEPSKSLTRADTDAEEENKNYDVAYEENGYSYGAGPINQSVYDGKAPNASMEFMTPAPKKKKDRLRGEDKVNGTTSEKKRKRRNDDHDMEEADTPMLDAPSSVLNNPGTPMLKHSGLTGGLDRMLRSPSQDGEDHPRRRYQDPSSPIKRSRRDNKDANGDGLGISMKNRAERLVSSMFGGSSVSGSSVNSRETGKAARASRRGSPDEGRSKKLPKVRNASNGQAESDVSKSKRKSSAQTDGDRPSRRQKQIDTDSRHDDNGREVVVYQQSGVPDGLQRQMATHFLSLVTKGPESTRGFSVNKVLKRFHRDFTDEFDDSDRGRDQGRSRADRERRADDEKELWRTLRLKQNERGEVVLFF